MKSKIRETIKDHQLVGGLPMKDITGDDIENSCVIDSSTFVYWDEKDKCVYLHRENAVTGEETFESFSGEAFAALQNCDILNK